MKIATKRILSAILCLSMLLSMLLVPVSATGHKTERSGVKAEKTVESKEMRSACTAESGEHSFDDSGACTTCGVLALIINMTDGYGDGWNNCAIKIYENGELVGTATLDNGASGTFVGAYDPSQKYVLCWVKGNYAEECSFELIIGAEVLISADESNCANRTDGEQLYSDCNHSYESVITAPTCTEDGYTTYTCAACNYGYTDNLVAQLGHTKNEGVVTPPTCTEDGYTSYVCTTCSTPYIGDGVPAVGHSYGDNNVCTVCGAGPQITITMYDSYGDGWGTNSIAVYENGTLITNATFENGAKATVSIDYSADNFYRFDWIKGDWPYECSFEICVNGETVYETANADDLEDQKPFFAICDHSWSEASCTAYSTCEHCGMTQGDLGHSWVEATCEAAKNCSLCGATEGEALGHEWLDANCQAPKTCDRCGATEGEISDHPWIEATCLAPKTCDVCGATEGEVDPSNHAYSSDHLLCPCGWISDEAMVVVSMDGTPVEAYTSFREAVESVAPCTEADKAEVKLLKNIDISDSNCFIQAGVFTLDLNGCTLTNDVTYMALNVNGDVSITITDSSEGGRIVNETYGIWLENGTVTVNKGTIIGGDYGMSVDGDNTVVNVNGGTISGAVAAVYSTSGYVNIKDGTLLSTYDSDVDEAPYSIFPLYVNGCTEVNISGGTISGNGVDKYGRGARGIFAYNTSVNISGGSIYGEGADICGYSCVTLNVNEDGVGATFPGGISVQEATLNTMLGENAAFWQDNKLVIAADDATEISGGDVVIKTSCPHEDATYSNNGEDHTFACSACGASAVQTHSYDADTLLCDCGAISDESVVQITLDGTTYKFCADLQTAFNIAMEFSAEDKAVLKLLKTADLGDDTVSIYDGTFTLDLNGFTIRSTDQYTPAIDITTDNELTITNGTIEGANTAVEVEKGKIMLIDLILGGSIGISAKQGEVIVRNCNIPADSSVIVQGGTVSIYDSYIEGGYDIDFRKGSVKLYEGTVFTDELYVYGTVLPALLAEDMAYWCNGKMFIPNDDADRISNGDVTIDTACKHENPTLTYDANYESHECIYSCCGFSYSEPHDPDTDGTCTLCGFNQANLIIINMTDSYGDGWNGNAIKVYEDGELIDTATIDDGSSNTWLGSCDPEKEYLFCWVLGSYPDECAFEIIICEETVCSTAYDDCDRFTDGYQIYPECEHDFDDGVVTPPACENNGYTTYTCSKCGYAYVDNIVDALSHTRGELISVTDPTCTEQGYTTYHCTVCGNDYNDDYALALGHTLGEGVVTEATCASNGYTTYTCTVCGENVVEDYVQALGHVLGEDGNCTVCESPYTVRVWVAGIQITAENMDDILCDLDEGATATYDPETNTLKLTDFVTENCDDAGIESYTPLNIEIYGENSIITDYEGIYFELASGDINISGTGSLYMDSSDEGILINASGSANLTIGGSVDLMIDSNNDEGIYMDGDVLDLLIEDEAVVTIGTDDTPIEEECIYIYGMSASTATITDNACVTMVTTDEEGIYLAGDEQCLTISEDAAVYADVAEEAIDVGTVIIDGGTVEVFGGEGCEGIYAAELIINGGDIVAGTAETETSAGDGIEADYIEINGGTVTVVNGGMIAWIYEDFEGEPSDVIVLGEGVYIESPEGGVIGQCDLTENNEGIVMAVLNSDGTFAQELVITTEADYGWTQLDGNWYYFEEETDLVKTGISRVPYPTEEIDGITYTPDQEAIDYYAGKNETFIDETEGWFYFNEDGVFQSDFNGMIETDDKNTYLENGFAVWNPGLVELDDGYYYFIGDTENGGNKPAVGNYYVGKNNTDLDITIGGVYTFDEDGKLCEYDGITDVDGTLYYYEDYQLMMGAGLIATGGSFYYVRSDGSLVAGQRYWVANTNGYKVSVGEYEFADDGKLIFPESTNKNGIYLERGAWYYYENGKKAYGKGLIFTDLHWYDEDGNDYWGEGGTIYVRSDGRLATGRYYITTIDNYNGAMDVCVGMVLNFNDMGMYIYPKNGIYEIDGVLRYFINDVMQYNSGIIVVDDNYYYVRSNGVVVSDCTYWVTNVGSSGVVAGAYVFDENGVMQEPKFAGEPVLNGIANGYFYENGNIAYNKGLTYLEAEGCYIYVRSNGMIATGKYWITNHNDLLPLGLYDFGEDGKLFR